MAALSKLLVVWTLALAACGGSSDSPPGPLGKHFDDMYIAQIPLDQKTQVVQTQNDWSLAKMQNAKAEADYNESATAIQVARNDLKASRLGVDSAITQKKSAQASNDNNRINQSTKDEQVAEHLAKAAEARVKYLEAYRDYLKVVWRNAQENMYWREAQYELAKSSLAQKSNISPKGVKYEWYGQQEQERGKRAATWKGKLGDKQKATMASRENWLKLQKAADTENGHPSSLPDPMAPAGAGAATASDGVGQSSPQ
jgi:hypothetical protein